MLDSFRAKNSWGLSQPESREMSTTTLSQTRQCKSCKKSRPIEDFHSSGDGKTKRWVCKECRNTKNQDYYQQKTRNSNLLNKYGITVEDYDRLLAQQQGLCAICGSERGATSFHVDHDHNTGKVRGFLCARCNIALGGFGDDAAISSRRSSI